MLTPLIKTPGGKRKLAPEIISLVPSEISAYYEPFFGGGAIYCELFNAGRLTNAHTIVLNDLDWWLIELLQAVKDDPKDLFERAQVLATQYEKEPEKTYYAVRDLWNGRHFSPAKCLFLRKASFNGMWRESKTRKMNVPWGKHEKLSLPSLDLLLEWEEALQRVTLARGVWQEALFDDDKQAGTTVYFDPPYITTWNDYKAEGWGVEDFENLLKVCADWDEAGAFIVLSHCDAPEVRERLSNLWPKAELHETTRRNMINRDGAGREPTAELIVTSSR